MINTGLGLPKVDPCLGLLEALVSTTPDLE